MWLAQELSRRGSERAGEISTGKVSVAGDKAAVMLDGERRGITVACPGGLRWNPAAGEDVIVLRSGDGEQFVLGVAGNEDEIPEKGGYLLKSGGNSLALGSAGVEIKGDIAAEGRLLVNGCDILAAIEELRGVL